MKLFFFVAIAASAHYANGAEGRSVNQISVDEAKALVAQVSEVAAKFNRSTTCSVIEVAPASEVACQFYMLHASCAASESAREVSRDFAVNKVNGDVEPIDRKGNAIVQEPSLLHSQQRLLALHGITEQAAVAARSVSREGCLYK